MIFIVSDITFEQFEFKNRVIAIALSSIHVFKDCKACKIAKYKLYCILSSSDKYNSLVPIADGVRVLRAVRCASPDTEMALGLCQNIYKGSRRLKNHQITKFDLKN